MGYSTDFKSIRSVVSAAEWQARVDLAACYRLVEAFGMTDLTYNHITARIPGTEDHLLINLYGLLYREITASSLVKIDIAGTILWQPETDYGINKSGYVIHGAIHAARPDVTCIIHTHTRAGMAIAAMKCGLLPLSQTAMRFVGHLGYHDYEGPAIDLDERARLVRDLGPHDAMVMRSHGLLTCGATIPQAFNTMYQLNCRAAARSTPWQRAPSSSCLRTMCWRTPRISISRARGGLTACSNGRPCCASSPPRGSIRRSRHIGVKYLLSRMDGPRCTRSLLRLRHEVWSGHVSGLLNAV